VLTDEPDRELTCVGYWMEDMRSYLITYDEEDPVTKFRCWVGGTLSTLPGTHLLELITFFCSNDSSYFPHHFPFSISDKKFIGKYPQAGQ